MPSGKKVLFCLLAVLLLGSLAAIGGCSKSTPTQTTGATPASVIYWRSSTPWGWYSFAQRSTEIFASSVNKNSGGRLVVTPMAGGEIVPSAETMDAAAKGVFEVSIAQGTYHTQTKALAIDSRLPYAFTGFGSSQAAYDFIVKEGILDIFAEDAAAVNLKLVRELRLEGCSPLLYSMKPIRSMSDWKGLRVNAAGPSGDFFKEVGAAPTWIAYSEVPMAMKTGTLDAAIFDQTAMFQSKYYELKPYYHLPALNEVSFYELTANMDAWNRLPEDLQEVVSNAAKEYDDFVNNGYIQEWQKVIDREKEYGYTIVRWDDAFFKQMADIAVQKVWPKTAADSPRAEKIISILKKHYGYK